MVLILHDSNFEVLFAVRSDKKAGIKHFFYIKFPVRAVLKKTEKKLIQQQKRAAILGRFFLKIFCAFRKINIGVQKNTGLILYLLRFASAW